MATSESFGNFDLVKRVKLDYTAVEVSKWRSRDSGLSIVHIDYEGVCHSVHLAQKAYPSTAPIVKGYFVVATESTDYLEGCQDKRSLETQFSTTLDVRIRWNSASRSPTQQRPH